MYRGPEIGLLADADGAECLGELIGAPGVHDIKMPGRDDAVGRPRKRDHIAQPDRLLFGARGVAQGGPLVEMMS